MSHGGAWFANARAPAGVLRAWAAGAMRLAGLVEGVVDMRGYYYVGILRTDQMGVGASLN
jgi:hypothetical protein